MSFDKNLILFEGELFTTAHEYNAAVEGDESEGYCEALYEEFKASGSNQTSWLKERLKDEFLYVDQPPVWVGEEPSWAFYEGKPMIFISQYAIPETDLTKEKLTYDETIYTFGIRIPGKSKGGFDMLYKTIIQTSW